MASRNIALIISKIITIVAQSFDLKEVLITKLSDWLWCLKFRIPISNQIFDYEYTIHEITLCDSSPRVIADLICYEIGEINYRHRHQAIGDITCLFNARSPQLRCGVNPSGPCAGCDFYETNQEQSLSPYQPIIN